MADTLPQLSAAELLKFSEINPNVVQLANEYFTFLADSDAEVNILLGDARLSMERQTPQRYDIIALDAFSGDAVPAPSGEVPGGRERLRGQTHSSRHWNVLVLLLDVPTRLPPAYAR